MIDPPARNVVAAIKQSPPIDLLAPYSTSTLANKTIIITGGASGFGLGFVRAWAAAGATVIASDINVKAGDATVREVRKDTGNQNVHFIACDVRDWQQQVDLFKESARLSPHGGIDVVVANAGIAGMEPIQMPGNMMAAEPPKPDLRVIDVNLIGVLYTVHLAMFWLPRNANGPGRDRCLLLVGSLASVAPIPTQVLYGAAKHGVMGLFRTLRASAFVEGIRVNMINPYFIETRIMQAPARIILAGGGMGKVEDVVDAASRLVATDVAGRALCIGPNVRVTQGDDGEWHATDREDGGVNRAIWEVYADDFVDTEVFTARMVKILNAVENLKGWTGWALDIAKAVKYALFG